jgi:RNA polymerase sigma-70 factor, ECF subfamily
LEFYKFDSNYIERLIAGDRAFESHFTEYFSQLILIKLRARQYAAHLIEDIRQETFLRVFRTLHQGGLRNPEGIGAFVNSVCNNVTFELSRSSARLEAIEPETEVADSAAQVERELLTDETQREVRHVLSKLSPQNRSLLTMLFLEERPKDEICSHFGIDRNYLRVLLFRARAEFKERLLRHRQPEVRSAP